MFSPGKTSPENVSIISYSQFLDIIDALKSLPSKSRNVSLAYKFGEAGAYTRYIDYKEYRYQYNHYVPEYNVSVTAFVEYDTLRQPKQDDTQITETIFTYPGGIEIVLRNTGREISASIVLRESSINAFLNVFSNIYQTLYPSEIPYLQDEALAMQQYVYNELGITNMSQLPKARNITFDDLTYGKLVGSNIHYKMTYRLQAPLSLLVVLGTNLWCISTHSVRLLSDNVYDNVDDGIRLSVMFGQIIPNTLRNNSYWSATNSKYLFFIEDVYAVAGQKLVNDANLEERLNYGLGWTQYLSNRIPSILTVYRKSMYGINTTRDFYTKQTSLQNMLSVFRNNGIGIEGTLFIPNNVKFTEMYGLGYTHQDISVRPQMLLFRDVNRRLMDFAIQWRQSPSGLEASLQTIQDGNYANNEFGWKLSAADFGFKSATDLIHRVPNSTVVEGYYSPKANKFVLVRVRDDRKYPNSLDAIKNIYNLTLTGPSEDLFYGRNFQLLSNYLSKLLLKLPYRNYIYYEDEASPIDKAIVNTARDLYHKTDTVETVLVTNNMLTKKIRIGNTPERIIALCVDKRNVLSYFSNPTTFTLLTPAVFTLFTASYKDSKFELNFSPSFGQVFKPFDLETYPDYKIVRYSKCDGELLLNPDELVLSRFFSLIVLEKH